MATALTATVQPTYGRTQLQLTWTTVTAATVARVHADGSSYTLRNANPAAVSSTSGVGAIIWDHEAPLDQAVTYQATSSQAPGTTVTSSAVTLASPGGYLGSQLWLTHPLKPALSQIVTVDFGGTGQHTRQAVSGSLPILNSPYPVAITAARQAGSGSLSLTTDTAQQAVALRALVADGSVLLARGPGAWVDPVAWAYLLVGDLTEVSSAGHAQDTTRDWTLPYIITAPVAGIALAAVGTSYAEMGAAYPTYSARQTAKPTYLDAMKGV